MKFVFPDLRYKDKAIEYINEFYEYGSNINGTGGLDSFLKNSTYEDWLKNVLRELDIANIPDGKVPAITYFFVDEETDRIIGMVNIRLALNDFLRTEGGHIGYSIRPTERRKHYATEQLKAALSVCRKIGIENVLISCDKLNIASSGVIKKCGGILHHEIYSEKYDENLEMYVIKTTPDE